MTTQLIKSVGGLEQVVVPVLLFEHVDCHLLFDGFDLRLDRVVALELDDFLDDRLDLFLMFLQCIVAVCFGRAIVKLLRIDRKDHFSSRILVTCSIRIGTTALIT